MCRGWQNPYQESESAAIQHQDMRFKLTSTLVPPNSGRNQIKSHPVYVEREDQKIYIKVN